MERLWLVVRVWNACGWVVRVWNACGWVVEHSAYLGAGLLATGAEALRYGLLAWEQVWLGANAGDPVVGGVGGNACG